MKKRINIIIYIGVFLLAFIMGVIYVQSSEKEEVYEGKIVKKEIEDSVKSIKIGNFQTVSVVPFPTKIKNGYVVTFEDENGTSKVVVRKKEYDKLLIGKNMKYKKTFLGEGYDFEINE